MTIVIEELVETQYGEKAVIESPYHAKDYIKVLPWQPDEFQVADIDDDNRNDVREAVEEFDFPQEFTAHPRWNGDAWEIDASAALTAAEFWAEQNFNVEIEPNLQERLSDAEQ